MFNGPGDRWQAAYGVEIMRKKVNLDQTLRRVFLGGGIMGAIAGILFTVFVANIIISRKETDFESQNAKLTQENEDLKLQLNKYNAAHNNSEILSGEDGWALALVNDSHPLDTSYAPAELYEVESERSVDARIREPLDRMLADAEAAGLSMYVASAYRSYAQQIETFNASMQNRLNQQMTPLEAYQETSTSVALPGTSEHATGLAVDIISTSYGELDDRQGDTAEQKWLMEHCWEYGFILRYPPEKSDITGIIYEPWHYRYVGKDAAQEITEQGITLEEYLE